jgi:5-methyltetrahydropteroyltriglutamate--homocysteine methyltransferase
MQLSTDHILSTHVGSLPRPQAVVDFLFRKERGEAFDAVEFSETMHREVERIVERQVKLGIDIVSDGETSKIGYATYIKDRLSGFGGNVKPKPHLDLREHPQFREKMTAFLGPQTFRRMQCIGPIKVIERQSLKEDIDNFRSAIAAAGACEGFMNSASPGVIASFQPNAYYPTHGAYIEAIAEVMKEEYEAIAGAGLILQVDCPDLAMSRHTGFQDLAEGEFLKIVEHHVEALNYALTNVPATSVRMHVCWGNYEGPHDHDIPLERIIALVLKAKPQAISFEASNPRHAHEWAVWKEARIPDDKVLIPGVLDTSTNFVEHPELVAQRIIQFTDIVGRQRVLAGTDCGFGTFAGMGKVDPDIAFKKLRSLVQGAAIASKRLWN